MKPIMQGENKTRVQRVAAWRYALASAVLLVVAFHPSEEGDSKRRRDQSTSPLPFLLSEIA